MAKAKKPEVLVVEDEASVLLTYRMMLEEQGYIVSPALSSQEAEALLTCVREYIAILLERGRLGDQNLSSAASRLYSAMLESGVTPPRLE